MEVLQAAKVWTEEDLMVMPEVTGKCELVGGELVVGPCGYRHEVVISALEEHLRRFVRIHKLGVVAGSNLGCWMRNGNLRCPDLSFITTQRLKRIARTSTGFIHGAPDLAVEILSPSDTLAATRVKSREYFNSGCRLCWIVDPEDRTVLIARPNGPDKLLTREETLDGENLLPGFSIPVSWLFEDLDYLDEEPDIPFHW